jgi:hypothetical protein
LLQRPGHGSVVSRESRRRMNTSPSSRRSTASEPAIDRRRGRFLAMSEHIRALPATHKRGATSALRPDITPNTRARTRPNNQANNRPNTEMSGSSPVSPRSPQLSRPWPRTRRSPTPKGCTRPLVPAMSSRSRTFLAVTTERTRRSHRRDIASSNAEKRTELEAARRLDYNERHPRPQCIAR